MTNKIFSLLAILLVNAACTAVTAAPTFMAESSSGAEAVPVPVSKTPSLSEQVLKYEHRYQLNTLGQKLVDNQGNGYEALYGVRNFRTVLRGIVYRGGANNYYNKYKKRDNSNPLPTMGLQNLCQEGFKSAIYLYSTNFSTAPKSVNCQQPTDTGSGETSQMANQINYRQINALDEKNSDVFLELLYKAIKGQIPSPIYLHCWNGWHASGFVSSLALRQFCGMSGADAVKYWMANTDGNSAGHEDIMKRINAFKPRPQFQITAAEQHEICLPN